LPGFLFSKRKKDEWRKIRGLKEIEV